MDPYVIELSGLTKQYGSLRAVDRLDLSIKKGEVFGLLGPNGAGKSTTILMILGLTEPSAGTVRVCGIDATVNPIDVKRRVGYLPDDVGFYDNRSGLDNLLYTAGLNRIPPEEARQRAWRLLEQVGLSNDAGKKAGAYSRGMRQRLGLADVLIKAPEIIILDEPTLGIDPRGVREFLNLIVQLSREEGLTVLLSSHHLHQVQQVCDRVGLFVGGKLLAEGDIATLSAKLFTGEPFIIEAGVSCPAGISNPGAGAAQPASGAQPASSAPPPQPAQSPQPAHDLQRLRETLRRIDGVNSVQLTREMFRIGCSHDATAAIAKTVVESGFGLTHLQRKEYGLDDIYNRYFEGGVYEQTA